MAPLRSLVRKKTGSSSRPKPDGSIQERAVVAVYTNLFGMGTHAHTSPSPEQLMVSKDSTTFLREPGSQSGLRPLLSTRRIAFHYGGTFCAEYARIPVF